MDYMLGKQRSWSQMEWARFEKRGSRRIEVISGLLPGELVATDTGEPFAAVAVNVSENGFALETEYLLQPGMGVSLCLPAPFGDIPLKVVWSDWANFGHSKMRCGLMQTGTQHDLEEIFRLYGCLEMRTID